MSQLHFRQPFYVSPHAVARFRERVADLPTRTIRTIIQATLQDSCQPVGINGYYRGQPSSVVYAARYRDVDYLRWG